ncbi:MAG TPA: SpoIIE family protein phosphatase, partial [Terriglobales bacterium]|nr:SpoIIE family protein phosphatase [Terriglobales bacterium]
MSNESYIWKAASAGLAGLFITAAYVAIKEASFYSLGRWQSHIIAALFCAIVVFMLSAPFLRREQVLAEKLLEAKCLSEALIENLPGVVCIFDAAGKVRHWNSNFLGYAAGEMFRIGVFGVVAQESHEIVRQAMQNAFEEGSSEAEAWVLAKSGIKIPCYLTGVRITVENEPCILGVGIEVSKRTQAHKHVQPSVETLDAGWYLIESPCSGLSALTHPAVRLGPFTTEYEARTFRESIEQMPRFSNSVFELRKRRERRDKRLRVEYPVRVRRSSADDTSDTARTIDVSVSGACLGGLTTKLNTGEVVSVRCGDREAPFQIVWVGSGATVGQAGLECLAPRVNIWNLDLPEQSEDERLRQEVDRARTVQRKLLPQQIFPLRTLDYGGLCVQARTVGGDYYDFFPITPGEVGLVVADVAGKGIAAALLMANLQGILQAQVAFDSKDDLARLLGSVNRQLHAHTESARYATLFFGCYSDCTQTLRYVNCGHNPPVLLRHQGAVERLSATALVLGLFRDWECSVAEVHLEPGDIVSMYTDGITETVGTNEEEFGEARLLNVLR